MKFARKSGGSSADMDMTPMIDMVFQLITFFMFVVNFDQTQADERVKLPYDQLARPLEGPRPEQLVLNVGYLRNDAGNRTDPEPYVFYSGENVRVLSFGPKFLIERDVIAAKKGKDHIHNVTVIIRADFEVPGGLVQELIIQAQKAGFEKFALKAIVDSRQIP